MKAARFNGDGNSLILEKFTESEVGPQQSIGVYIRCGRVPFEPPCY